MPYSKNNLTKSVNTQDCMYVRIGSIGRGHGLIVKRLYLEVKEWLGTLCMSISLQWKGRTCTTYMYT